MNLKRKLQELNKNLTNTLQELNKKPYTSFTRKNLTQILEFLSLAFSVNILGAPYKNFSRIFGSRPNVCPSSCSCFDKNQGFLFFIGPSAAPLLRNPQND
jgi:hypothetical protein